MQFHTLKMSFIPSEMRSISYYSKEMQQPCTPLPQLPLMKSAFKFVHYFVHSYQQSSKSKLDCFTESAY